MTIVAGIKKILNYRGVSFLGRIFVVGVSTPLHAMNESVIYIKITNLYQSKYSIKLRWTISSVHFSDGFCVGYWKRFISCAYQDCNWLYIHFSKYQQSPFKMHWQVADVGLNFSFEVKSLASLYKFFLFTYE